MPRGACSTVLACALLAGHAVADAPRELRVMAFNVLFRGADDAASLDAIAAEAADVVCLTELTPTFAGAFERKLGVDYPHRRFAARRGTWGVGVASRLPLRKVSVGPVAPSGIPAMEATVLLGKTPVTLLCVHLTPPVGKYRKDDTLLDQFMKNEAVRVKQAQTLVARYRRVDGPVVLLGDFNEDPTGPALLELSAAGFRRGCDSGHASCAPTFPGPAVRWPALVEIDHVFARGLEVDGARTVHAGGSDHFPVAATLRRTPGTAREVR